jgi:hypothetical protein
LWACETLSNSILKFETWQYFAVFFSVNLTSLLVDRADTENQILTGIEDQ